MVQAAFEASLHGDGTKVECLSGLQEKDSFIPELSLVAEGEPGEIVGQIVLCRTLITTEQGPVVALAPSPCVSILTISGRALRAA